MKVCTYCNSVLQAVPVVPQHCNTVLQAVPVVPQQSPCEDSTLRRGSLNQLMPSPVAVKKTAAGISAAKRRHLVGRCHSDTSQLQGVQSKI